MTRPGKSAIQDSLDCLAKTKRDIWPISGDLTDGPSKPAGNVVRVIRHPRAQFLRTEALQAKAEIIGEQTLFDGDEASIDGGEAVERRRQSAQRFGRALIDRDKEAQAGGETPNRLEQIGRASC